MPLDLMLGRAGFRGLAAALVTIWALLGGVVLLGIILVNFFSVLGGIFWKPFPGDFELTEIGVAVAAFSFLPYAQITGSNVTADIFTAKASPRVISVLTCLAAIIAAGFAALMLRQMFLGMLDQKEYNYTSSILQIPIWWGFVPILISFLLLILTAAVTFYEQAVLAAGEKA